MPGPEGLSVSLGAGISLSSLLKESVVSDACFRPLFFVSEYFFLFALLIAMCTSIAFRSVFTSFLFFWIRRPIAGLLNEANMLAYQILDGECKHPAKLCNAPTPVL